MEDENGLTRTQFMFFIRDTLAAHPDWLDACIQATTLGIQSALAFERATAGRANAAMLAALCLTKESRITANTRDMLGKVIDNGIYHGPGASPIEKEWANRKNKSQQVP